MSVILFVCFFLSMLNFNISVHFIVEYLFVNDYFYHVCPFYDSKNVNAQFYYVHLIFENLFVNDHFYYVRPFYDIGGKHSQLTRKV